jgi:hypothetical protein
VEERCGNPRTRLQARKGKLFSRAPGEVVFPKRDFDHTELRSACESFCEVDVGFSKNAECSKSVISPEAHYLEVRQTFFQGIDHFVVALRIRRLQEEAGFDQQWQ